MPKQKNISFIIKVNISDDKSLLESDVILLEEVCRDSDLSAIGSIDGHIRVGP
jgi:hypothetical protein